MIAIGLCFGEQLLCLAPDALGFLEEIEAVALLLLISGLHNGLRNVLLVPE